MPVPLSRQQLARFIKDNETIIRFQQLFDSTISQSDIDQINADIAAIQAAIAIIQAQIADIYELVEENQFSLKVGNRC